MLDKNKNKLEEETATESIDSLRNLIEEQTNKIAQLTSELQRSSSSINHSPKSPVNSNGGSPIPGSLESLIEQKQKTIDGLTGVLNLTSAHLETEKYNNKVIVQNLQADIYNKDLQINELRIHIDHLNRAK